MSEKGADDSESARSAIINLAVQLLSLDAPTSVNHSSVEAAVGTAKQLLEAAGRPKKQQAYEIFDRGMKMNSEEIGDVLKEHEWPAPSSKASVTGRLRTLLEALFRDISIRGALLETAVREIHKVSRLPAPVDLASDRIKALLTELGLDTAFGAKLDDAARTFSLDLINTGLNARRGLEREIKAFQRFTPALFDEICGGSSYLDYATFRKPPEDLQLDELAAVIIYMGSLSECLPHDRNQVLNIVFSLDSWPALLLPQNSRFSSPFAEFIAHSATEEREIVQRYYDTGLAQFYNLWATLKLKELVTGLEVTSDLETLNSIFETWFRLPTERREELSESFEDPVWVIQSLSRFLRGEPFSFVRGQPFDGHECTSPLLKVYVRWLSGLRRALADLSMLAAHLDLEKNLKDLEAKLCAERTEAIQLDVQLQDPSKIELGKVVVHRFLSQKFNPGKINPNLLFRYASERGLLENELTRSRPTATTAKEPKS